MSRIQTMQARVLDSNITDLARAVIESDMNNTKASRKQVEAILEIAFLKLGLLSSMQRVRLNLGNGYNLHCHTNGVAS